MLNSTSSSVDSLDKREIWNICTLPLSVPVHYNLDSYLCFLTQTLEGEVQIQDLTPWLTSGAHQLPGCSLSHHTFKRQANRYAGGEIPHS